MIRPLLGQKRLQLQPGHNVVPLLHPTRDELPFSATLVVVSGAARNQQEPASASLLEQHQQQPASLVELAYVISGSGHVTSAASGPQPLLPGDSLLALHGAAAFCAGPPPVPRGAAEAGHARQQEAEQQPPPIWAQLLSWL